MKERLKFAVVGLGARGKGMIEEIMLKMDDIDIIAVCDTYQDRCEDAVKTIKENKNIDANFYLNHKELIENEKIDAVYIATSWQTHIEVVIDFMEAGIANGSEVGCSFSVNECFELVKTYEKTKTPCMFMENCCYGREEMMVMNMIDQGVFGEIVHCSGGYHHDLRQEIAKGRENRHYRLDNYIKRNCENYPTHELGPIAKILNINRGNKMLTLTSTSSKSIGLKEYIKTNTPDNDELKTCTFAQGDVVTTVIKCAGGETITLTLDTTLPRAYSRGLTVHGTKALFTEDNRSLFIDGVHNEYDFEWKKQFNNLDEYQEQYDHQVWKDFLQDGVKGGHGGMDWLLFRDFIDCVKADKPMPIDVYDMASWLVVGVLSEQSIAQGGQPISFPDFTNGKWMTRD